MKELEEIKLNLGAIERHLIEFENLLKSSTEIEENILLKFFQSRPQLVSFIGILTDFGYSNRYAYEFPIVGEFKTDFIVGSAEEHSYLLIEFESAKNDSIFKKKSRSLKEWSPRFEHGYSQIVDWFWQIQDIARTDILKRTFGVEHIKYNGLLVIGRNKGLSEADSSRLMWRRDNVLVNNRKINCLTYDQLFELLEQKIKHLKSLRS
ncbi:MULTISPECIES: Shedu immune nuclease family protein [Emticicia]|uniref:Shedu immune nuclease family protein n=1 Tax=Emticicia TaxID=312278 RepID=UPI0007D89C00|nr:MULTISPECIES: Shedu immune nuclease family protein [Emticicia]